MRKQQTVTLDADRILSKLIADEGSVTFASNDPYLRSYPEFVRYFRSTPVIEAHHVVIGASFVYSWMPTILRFKSAEFDVAAAILQRCRNTITDNGDLSCLSRLINNSLVGTSKLLHFVNPELYAIWDSRVCKYLTGKAYPYQVENVTTYRSYLNTIHAVVEQPRFDAVHASVCEKVGYIVTKPRAAELVMFMSRDVRDVPTDA